MSILDRCDRIRTRLPGLLDDPDALGVADQEHLATCLRCQADLARHRRIQRAVASLADQPVPVDPEGLDPMLDRLDAAIDARHRRRVATIRALTGLVAAVALAAAVIGLVGRRRRC